MPRERPQRKGSPINLYVVAAVLGFLAVVGVVVGLLWQQSAKENEKKAEMLEQRRIYDKWVLESREVKKHEEDLQYYKRLGNADQRTIDDCQRKATEARKKQKAIEEESQKRWGKHPAEFKDQR